MAKRLDISFLPYSLGQWLAARFAHASWRFGAPVSSASSGSQMLDVTRDAQPEQESKISCSCLCGNGDSCPGLTRLLLSQEPCKHPPKLPSCIIAEQGWWKPPHEETLPSNQEISPPPLGFICNSMTLGLIEEAGTSHHLWAVQWVFPSAENWKEPVLHCFEWKRNESKCNVVHAFSQL